MKKMLAGLCNSCPLCRYARKKPDSLLGKIVCWHGSWCPAWKAWEQVYGEVAAAEVIVKETEPMTTAFLSMKGPYAQVSEAFNKLYGWIALKGYQSSGPPLGIYFNAPGQVPDDELVWELLSPISEEVAPSEPDEQGFGIKILEATQVASITHKGPYEEIGKTFEGLTAWIKDKGYEIAGPAQEVYLNNPAETPPEELLTEVRFPVQGK